MASGAGSQTDLEAALQQVGHAGRHAAIGHRSDVELVLVLQQLARKMERRAVARVQVVEPAGIGLGVVDQLLQRPDRERRIDRRDRGRDGGQRDRLEVRQRIVWNGLQKWHHDMADRGHHAVVSVGRRLRDHRRGQCRIAAGLGFDHHGLAEVGLHGIGKRAGDDVDDAARREGHQDADGFVGIGLGRRTARRRERSCRAQRGAAGQSVHWVFLPAIERLDRPSTRCHPEHSEGPLPDQ